METALADLRRLPAAQAPDAVVLLCRIPYSDAYKLARETVGLAAVLFANEE